MTDDEYLSTIFNLNLLQLLIDLSLSVFQNPYWVSQPLTRAPYPPRRQASLDRDRERRVAGGKRPYPFNPNPPPANNQDRELIQVSVQYDYVYIILLTFGLEDTPGTT